MKSSSRNFNFPPYVKLISLHGSSYYYKLAMGLDSSNEFYCNSVRLSNEDISLNGFY